jgi:hypothetical protein
VAELGHGTGFDLTDPLTGEVEVHSHLFEGTGLFAVQAETETENLAFTLVQQDKKACDLRGQQRR